MVERSEPPPHPEEPEARLAAVCGWLERHPAWPHVSRHGGDARGRWSMMLSMAHGTPPGPRLHDLARLRRVRDRIDREFARPLDVEVLAREAHMSAGHLSRQFKLAYGESPYGYLMTRRIERAMTLLRRGDLSVTEVCFEVGCSSLGSFSTRFKALVGVAPSLYREREARATLGMPPCVAKQVTRPARGGSSTSRRAATHDGPTRRDPRAIRNREATRAEPPLE